MTDGRVDAVERAHLANIVTVHLPVIEDAAATLQLMATACNSRRGIKSPGTVSAFERLNGGTFLAIGGGGSDDEAA